MKKLMEVEMKSFLDPKTLTFVVWGLKTILGKLGPKRHIKP